MGPWDGHDLAQFVLVISQQAGHGRGPQQLLNIRPSGGSVRAHQPGELEQMLRGHLQKAPSGVADGVLVCRETLGTVSNEQVKTPSSARASAMNRCRPWTGRVARSKGTPLNILRSPHPAAS
jgi:hypothetical protein